MTTATNIKLLLNMVIFLIFGFSAFAGPSFNCKFARSESEKEICSSEPLSGLDREVAEEFKSELQKSRSEVKAKLKTNQKTWLVERDKCKDDSSCLYKIMKNRIDEIHELQINFSKTPKEIKLEPLKKLIAQKVLKVYLEKYPANFIFNSFDQDMIANDFAHVSLDDLPSCKLDTSKNTFNCEDHDLGVTCKNHGRDTSYIHAKGSFSATDIKVLKTDYYEACSSK